MSNDLQTHVAFYLTGKRAGPGLDEVDGLQLRPALFAGYRDLTQLRYDYPVVLDSKVRSLKSLFDEAFQETASDPDADKLRKHGLAQEREIRVLVAKGKKGRFSTLWEEASSRLDDTQRESIARLRKVVTADGEVVDCDKALPETLLRHAWSVVQERKGRAFREKVDRLLLKLSDILRADLAGSNAGRSAESLKATFGSSGFDFDAMSNLLTKSVPESTLPKSRRKRIEWLVNVLQSQTFFEKTGKPGHDFVFESCEDALEAYRERLPMATELAKAMAIADLEVEGGYDEAKHDSFFSDFGSSGLDPKDLAALPDTLICLDAGKMTASESEKLADILSAGLPIKMIVRTDDLLETSALAEGHIAIGARAKQLANMAIGLTDVFVLQSPSSNLVKLQGAVFDGFRYPGPALFSVFSGAHGFTGGIPPYLVGAAAMESRAFPTFVYDPSAGSDWASRFRLDGNQQADRDWPVQGFAYEDERLQRVSEEVPFTLVDFVACDRRFARHFARVPREHWNGTLTSVGETIQESKVESPKFKVPDRVPSVLMVDQNNVLQRVLVDDTLIRETRRCADMWRSLQELGGIRNSHAERLLEQERKVWEEEMARELASHKPEPAVADSPVHVPADTPTPSPTDSTATVAEPVEEKKSDEPYIETPRCTTCNECTTINNKMFAYNENKQAYIADPSAGTYKQLVEAAESCQVSIIHPGKPRNPNEPGLEDLLKRAELFL